MSNEPPKNDPVVPTDLPGNSYNAKRPSQKPLEKAEENRPEPTSIVKSDVFKKKRGMASKFRESFTGDDSKTVVDYIAFEVLVPSLKNMIAEAGKEALDRLLFGGTARSTTTRSAPTAYGKMYNNRDDRRPKALTQRARETHDFDEITLKDKGDAENVIDQLFVLVEDYGSAKVSDLYSLIGQSHNYVDGRWGWTDLRGAMTVRVRDGYLLDLPRPVPLK